MATAKKADKKVEKPELSDDEFWLMYLSMVRYSMGRSSYIVGECETLYSKYKEKLRTHQIAQIAKEIQDEILRVRPIKRPDGTPGLLGMRCDDDTWLRLAKRMEQDVSQRAENASRND